MDTKKNYILITFPKCAFKYAVYDCLRWINCIDAHQSRLTFRRSESHDLMQIRKTKPVLVVLNCQCQKYLPLHLKTLIMCQPLTKHFSPTTRVFCKLITFKEPLWFAQWQQLPFLFCIKFPKKCVEWKCCFIRFLWSLFANSQLG